MSSTPSLPDLGRELRWIANAYEQAQQARIQAGERIRALVQGRSEPSRGTTAPVEPDALLAAIRRGEQDGPLPIVGRAYRRQWEQEEEMATLLQERLELHPAWPWLRGVRGVGATLAGKLVARLDVTKAETPSSFWAYCGLATVPGVEYRCSTCGHSGSFPAHQRVSGQHNRLGTAEPCAGRLLPAAGPESGVRVAQPRPGRGEKAAYDREAKKTCYLIGISLLRARGAYERYYRREREKLDASREGWAEGRRHLAALRKTEKLFLAQLWIVWRQAVDLPITRPFGHPREEQSGWIDPWEMVAAPPRRRWSRPEPIPAPKRVSG